MQPEPALVARHLERSFGAGEAAARALRDVSLELHRGQVLLLMGPSGSGKSTLLAVLSGLLRPDRGEVMILGEDLWRMSERPASGSGCGTSASSSRASTCSPR